MRKNLPVTQKEYVLPEDSLLVSYTDLHGNITLANEAFVEASGFEYKELLEQPHNILRHPDVPEQVFFDFWRTIQEGRPWRQIVKNRRKNGDHYWVEANATPIVEHGKITGYMSVRRPATEEEKKNAEAAYKAINDKKIRLKYGEVEKVLSRFNPLPNINPPVTTIPAALISMVVFGLQVSGNDVSLWLEVLLVFLTVVASAHALYFVNQIKNAIRSIDEVASGKLDGHVDVRGENFGGVVNRRIKTMQIRLNATNNDFKTEARKSQRMQSGLNNLNAFIMIADRTRTITYINPSLQAFLKKVEADFKKELPHFDASNLIGQSIDVFHKNPQHQIDILDKLTEQMVARIEVAGHSLQLVISPITDPEGNSIGTVVEWQDIFQELYVQESITSMVSNADAGDLSGRIELAGLDGFYKDLGGQFNSLMSRLQSVFDEISYIVAGLSDGDLTRVPKSDYQGQYKQALEQLSKGINDLRVAFCKVDGESEEVAKVAKQVTESNQKLEQGIKQQVNDMQNTSSSLEHITNQIIETADKAKESDHLASETQDIVYKGGQYMRDAIDKMNEIEAVSGQITGIITLIDSIAFQTNLLALNAAVEAARAGEHGRGFAVVAGEVRALAQKSAEAAKDIKQLVETSSDKIREGTEKVQITGSELEKITEYTKKVVENISDISANAQEQSSQINEINQAVLRVLETANDSQEQIQEGGSLASFLGLVSEHMDELVSRFNLGECPNIDTTTEEGEKHKVLVVEDQLPNQKIAEAMLRKLGFSVDLASDGQEGVSAVKNTHYDLILMDLSMPVKDGIAATKEIRALGVKTPVYAYTGKAEMLPDDYSKNGFHGILHKPISYEELQEIMTRL